MTLTKSNRPRNQNCFYFLKARTKYSLQHLLTSVNACCKRPANFKPANRMDPQANLPFRGSASPSGVLPATSQGKQPPTARVQPTNPQGEKASRNADAFANRNEGTAASKPIPACHHDANLRRFTAATASKSAAAFPPSGCLSTPFSGKCPPLCDGEAPIFRKGQGDRPSSPLL